MTARRSPPRVATVVSFLPNPYEHFLYRELAGLVRAGWDLEIFATRGAVETPVSEDVTLLAERTRYPRASVAALLVAHVWALGTRPVRYASLLIRVLLGHGLRPRPLGLAVYSFLIGVAVGMSVSRSRRELVMAEWANHPATVAYVAARISGARFIFKAHAGDIFLYPDPFLAQKAQEAEAVVSCTAEGAEALAVMAPTTPVFLVHHGLAPEWFEPRKEPLRDEPRLLLVGRLEGSKGEDVTLRALAILRDRNRRLPLTIIGAGPKKQETETLARTLGVAEQVTFTGTLTPREVRAAYDRHDVFVMPARRETHFGFPNVLVEAMARGLVAVVSPLPSIARLLQGGRHARLVPQEDPGAVADAIERYVAVPAEREAMARAGAEHVRSLFSLERTLVDLQKVLRDPDTAAARRVAPGPAGDRAAAAARLKG